MAMLTVRNLPDDAPRFEDAGGSCTGVAISRGARDSGHRRQVLDSRVRLGDALAALSRDIGLTNEDFEVFERVRDQTPAVPLAF